MCLFGRKAADETAVMPGVRFPARIPTAESREIGRDRGMEMLMSATVAAMFDARAETETVGGYTWTYRINGDTAGV